MYGVILGTVIIVAAFLLKRRYGSRGAVKPERTVKPVGELVSYVEYVHLPKRDIGVNRK